MFISTGNIKNQLYKKREYYRVIVDEREARKENESDESNCFKLVQIY